MDSIKSTMTCDDPGDICVCGASQQRCIYSVLMYGMKITKVISRLLIARGMLSLYLSMGGLNTSPAWIAWPQVVSGWLRRPLVQPFLEFLDLEVLMKPQRCMCVCKLGVSHLKKDMLENQNKLLGMTSHPFRGLHPRCFLQVAEESDSWHPLPTTFSHDTLPGQWDYSENYTALNSSPSPSLPCCCFFLNLPEMLLSHKLSC